MLEFGMKLTLKMTSMQAAQVDTDKVCILGKHSHETRGVIIDFQKLRFDIVCNNTQNLTTSLVSILNKKMQIQVVDKDRQVINFNLD